MRGRFAGLIVSAVLSSISIGLFFYPGLNLGIDFSGGVVMELRTPGPADFGKIRAALAQEKIGEQGVQRFGSNNQVLIRLRTQPTEAATQEAVTRVRAAMERAEPGTKVMRTDAVGASVSSELFRNGLMALGISLLMILVYIWFRFEWQFAVAGIVALVHDVFITTGMFSLLWYEFDLATVAALLTLAGYSINDTVVVFDRIRENMRKYKKMDFEQLLDLSINETLSRTVLTSSVTAVAVLALYLFGTEAIHGFSFAMLFGIIIGTYSSIFVAAPLLLYFGVSRETVQGTKDKDAAKTVKA